MTAMQKGDTMSLVLPITQVKSAGSNISIANTETGRFTGRIKDIRNITSARANTVFAVIDIEVPGKSGLFTDYLNFNQAKAEQSMSFLVNHIKQMCQSANQSYY